MVTSLGRVSQMAPCPAASLCRELVWDSSFPPLLVEGFWAGKEGDVFAVSQKARVFCGCGAAGFNQCLF